MSELIGVVLAFGIGMACRRFGVPLPAPQRLNGALLVVATTLGFVVADWFLGTRSTP